MLHIFHNERDIMKLSQKSGKQNEGAVSLLKNACAACYRTALARIAEARESILTEARETLAVQDKLLRLALNEAEALAAQTAYPYLLFPALAMEKVQSVAAWNARQAIVNRQTPVLSRAA